MRRLTVLSVVFALGAAACGSSTTTTPTTLPPVTDTFTGTVNPNGGVSHSFATALSGSVTATITSLAPITTVVVGLSLGTWNGTSCQSVLSNDRASLGTSITAQASAAGNLCVRVYDVGNIIDPVTYQVTIVHP